MDVLANHLATDPGRRQTRNRLHLTSVLLDRLLLLEVACDQAILPIGSSVSGLEFRVLGLGF